VLRTIRPLCREDVVRGQYRGYRSEKGVNPQSTVPTYAALKLFVDSWRWHDVPFFVTAGKSLKTSCSEVIVKLKNPPASVFHEPQPDDGNHLRFRLSPEVSIALGARAKRPGEGMIGEPVELSVVEDAHAAGRLDAYERLIGDAMQGDPTLFARQDAVEAAWSIVDPVLDDRGQPLHEYEPGTWGPEEGHQLTENGSPH
jgi:glucose-6-phosphate 1-dehydrogenase